MDNLKLRVNVLPKASPNSSSYVALCMPSPLNIYFFVVVKW